MASSEIQTKIHALIPSTNSLRFIVENGVLPSAELEVGGTCETTLLNLGKRVVGVATTPNRALNFGFGLLYVTDPIRPEAARLAENVAWAGLAHNERLENFARWWQLGFGSANWDHLLGIDKPAI